MFRFESIAGLQLLILVPILALALYVGWRYRREQMGKLGGAALLEKLTPAVSAKRSWIRKGLLLAAIGLICVGWANPQWGSKKERVKAESTDVYIALDISQSMMTADISPNRLERSKRFVQKLVHTLRGNRVGLVFFAGGAYMQMPLSDDLAAAELYIRSANTQQAGTQGTAIDKAIEMAQKRFDEDEDGGNHQRALIVVSDGEDHDEQAITAAKAARESGLVSYCVAVGTEDGGYVPYTVNGREQYKRDEDGRPVKSSVNINYLQEVAKAGGGQFYLVNEGMKAIDRISSDINKLEKREVELKSFTEYNSYYMYFVALALLLLGVEWLMRARSKNARKIGAALSLMLLACQVGVGQSAHDLLLEGDLHYEGGKFELAEESFRKAKEAERENQAAYNLGNTLYQQERMEEAQQSYEESISQLKNDEEKAAAYYNLGNTLFHQNEYKESIQAYKKALSLNEADEDAKANLLKAKVMQRQQEQQQQQQQNQEQSESEQSEDEPQEDNESKGDDEGQSQYKGSASEEESGNKDKEKQSISKEDAEKLLDIIDNEDQEVQQKLRKKGADKKPKKDW